MLARFSHFLLLTSFLSLLCLSKSQAAPEAEEVQSWIVDKQAILVLAKGRIWDDKEKIRPETLKNWCLLSEKEDKMTFNLSLKNPSEFQWGTGCAVYSFDFITKDKRTLPCLAVISYKMYTNKNPLEFMKSWALGQFYPPQRKPLLIQILPLKAPLQPLF